MPLDAPPIRTQLLNSDGTPARTWVKWWQQQQTLINTPGGQTLQVTQADLPTLGQASAGTLVYVTDYAHLLMWTGTGWVWAPGEIGSGYILPFLAGAGPGTGWHACDGSQQSVLQSDGTLKQVTLPLQGQGGNYGDLTGYFRL